MDRDPAQLKEVFEQRLLEAEAALAAEQARCAQLLDALHRAEFRSASLFQKLVETEDRLGRDLHRLAEDLHRLAAERARDQERIRYLDKVIADIHASTSWKASYPIRWVKRLIRR